MFHFSFSISFILGCRCQWRLSEWRMLQVLDNLHVTVLLLRFLSQIDFRLESCEERRLRAPTDESKCEIEIIPTSIRSICMPSGSVPRRVRQLNHPDGVCQSIFGLTDCMNIWAIFASNSSSTAIVSVSDICHITLGA